MEDRKLDAIWIVPHHELFGIKLHPQRSVGRILILEGL